MPRFHSIRRHRSRFASKTRDLLKTVSSKVKKARPKLLKLRTSGKHLITNVWKKVNVLIGARVESAAVDSRLTIVNATRQDELFQHLDVRSEQLKKKRPMRVPQVRVIHHRQETCSVSHLEYEKGRPFIERNAREHESAMATEPMNPILPLIGCRRHQYENYQIKVPVRAIVDSSAYRHDANRSYASYRWNAIACLRLMKRQGLREWEWTFGEPEETEDATPSNVHEIEDLQYIDDSNSNRSGENAVPEPCRPLTYAERVKTFTYTQGDDPMWKGKQYYVGRGYKVRAKAGNFSDKMSEEDQEYVPVVGDDIDPKKQVNSLRREYDNSVEQDRQTALTATEFLFGGMSQAEPKKMELGTDSQLLESRDGVVEVGPSRIEVGGERHRLSSSSGYSVMSDCSDDD